MSIDALAERGVKAIINGGALNPAGLARKVRDLVRADATAIRSQLTASRCAKESTNSKLLTWPETTYSTPCKRTSRSCRTWTASMTRSDLPARMNSSRRSQWCPLMPTSEHEELSQPCALVLTLSSVGVSPMRRLSLLPRGTGMIGRILIMIDSLVLWWYALLLETSDRDRDADHDIEHIFFPTDESSSKC